MATINDVARKAGVSKATVSNVFNNKKYVSDDVKRRVMEAAEEVNYKPSLLAIALAKNQTNMAGFFWDPQSDGLYKSSDGIILYTLLKELKKYGKKLICYCESGENAINVEAEPIDFAILLRPIKNDMRLKAMEKSDKKVIVIGRPDHVGSNIFYVDVDNVNMAYDMTRLFLRMGRKNILFINSAEELIITWERVEGYKKALEEHGISFDGRNMVFANDSEEDGYCAVSRFFNLSSVDGIITSSDLVATGVYRYLKEHGISIPQDISVAAMGGTDYQLEPELTVAAFDYRQLVTKAVEIAICKEDSQVLNSYSIQPRASVGEK